MKHYFVEYKFFRFITLNYIIWQKKHDCLKQYFFDEITFSLIIYF